MHPLIPLLATIADAHPAASVRFVSRELPFAREILRELTRARGALVGWEGTTLRQLAAELGAAAIDARGMRNADDLQLQSAADDALSATAASFPAPLRRQATSLGFRTAAFDAFAQLRIAGVSADELKRAARAGSPAEALAPAYAKYIALLDTRALADAADAFRAATAEVTRGTTTDVIVIDPGAADTSGLPRQFVEALKASGAIIVPLNDARPDFAATAANITLSRAISPAFEVREALRNALSRDLRWDDVELAVSDIDAYGAALASLGDELGIPYALKEGVPMVRSRAGRAVERYLQWLEDGLPATAIRQSLEQSELAVVHAEFTGADVARALRSAQVGWGRERWVAAQQRFADGSWARDVADDPDDPDRNADPELRAQRRAGISALAASLLEKLIELMPRVPPRTVDEDDAARIAVCDLAKHAIGWLALVAPALDTPNERHAVERLNGRLAQLADLPRSEVAFPAAIAELRQATADLRAFPSTDGARARRASVPGAVYLTDITQAGASGRRQLYLLGLDADRMSPLGSADPILDEETRAALNGAVPSYRERVARRERALWRALNGLNGNVHLSYSAQGDGAAREASPAPFFLDAARHVFAAPSLTYDQLRAKLGEPAGAARGGDPLDARDAWLQSLASAGDLFDGRAQVLDSWPSLARGVALHAAADGDAVTEWHGQVADAANKTGPFAAPDRYTSPTSLETLAKCPLSWFYKYALGLRPPEDVEYDPQQWIDARQHGALVHDILERFVKAWLTRQDELDSPQAEQALLSIAEAVIGEMRAEVPPPSEVVFALERERILRSVRQFLAQERQHREAAWHAVEQKFPPHGAQAVFEAADGTKLLVGGRIDRVDRYADGSMRIIDYKTGSSWAYRVSSKDPPLRGGRMLQPALYAAGAAQSLGGAVRGFEYRFPRERAPNDRTVLGPQQMADAASIVASLLTHLRTGNFIPTDDSSDCTYCDYREICRAHGERDKCQSPRAAWGDTHGEQAPQYAQLRRRRGKSGGAA